MPATDTTITADRIEMEPRAAEPGIEIAGRTFVRDGLDYRITVFGPGFEATRNLSTAELGALRDWIEAALAVEAA